MRSTRKALEHHQIGERRPRLAADANRWRALLACAVLATLLPLWGSGTASASWGSMGHYTGDGVHIRTGPSTSHASLGQGYRSHTACIYGAVVGEPVNGNPYWVDHTNFTTGVDGFSSAEFMAVRWPEEGCGIT